MNVSRFIPDGFSGVAFVKKGDQVLLEEVHGYADMANMRKNRIDTKFVTASAGKAFTGTGVLKLVESGRLNFNSPIKELLDFDLKRIDPDITVRHLLTHTSGMPDYCDETVMPNYADLFIDFPNYKIRASKDIVPLFIDMPMAYPKGDKFYYNNSGFVVLGLVIESVTGMPFDEFLRSEVFLPSGMEDTGYFEYDRLPANCANVYILDEKRGEYYTNIYSSTAKGLGDGGAFTTVYDVGKFWRALYSGKLIGKSLLSEMTAPQVNAQCYGYGLWLEEIKGHFVPHFEGCEPGISFLSTYDPEEDLLLTLVSNRGDDVWTMNRELLKNFYGDVPAHFNYGG